MISEPSARLRVTTAATAIAEVIRAHCAVFPGHVKGTARIRDP
jgi:hypothetical protein